MTDEIIKPTVTGRGMHPNSLAALKENEAATQFGGVRPNPQAQNAGGNKPWSVRMSARHLGRQKIDPSNPKSIMLLLGDSCTPAQLAAAKAWIKSCEGDIRATEYVTEQVDGKLAQPNLNADVAALQGMTDEQLLDIIDRFNAQREGFNGASDDSGGDISEAPGSEAPVS